MALTPYTTPNLVRALLGVATKELTDDVVNLPVYSTVMIENLHGVSGTLVADFQEIEALTSRTAEQTHFFDLTQAYCSYLVARQCVPAIGMFAPKEIKDDRTSLVRDANPADKLQAELDRSLSTVRRMLKKAYLKINPDAEFENASTATPLLVTISTLGTDPVTSA